MPQSRWLRDRRLSLVMPHHAVAFHDRLRLMGFDTSVSAIVLYRAGAELEGAAVMRAANTTRFEGRAIHPSGQVSTLVSETVQNPVFSHHQPGAAVHVEDATGSVFQICN